jgi:hypothetical protein
VEKHAVALGEGGRAADDVHDWDVLREGASDAIDSRELTNTKGGNEGSDFVDTRVAIGSVGCERGFSVRLRTLL